MQYSYREIEKKWQAKWANEQAYKIENDFSKPKCYVLDMFPYPSGAGLHVGHPLGYIASDIYARYKRLKGFNVLHPMGFDAFGLPAEQYAIETGQHPAVTTEQNIARYKEQLNNIGFCFDWSREVRTSDPSYYEWTQWIFLQLYKSWYNAETDKAEPIETLISKFQNENSPSDHRAGKSQNWEEKSVAEQEEILMQYRLAYRAESYVNWCEVLGTVLANDEVVNGVSERGGHPVERKLMSQWFLRITSFAERLLQGLELVSFPDSLKEMQKNWIGKSVGAEINFECSMLNDDFKIQNSKFKIPVFTTRPDTIFGVSFMVLAPEHELVSAITTPEQMQAVDDYKKYVSSRSERERLAETKIISGVFTGAYAIHPFTKKEIPIWISEYVLAGYGTGAIMAVPCGDERDYAFAKHFKLPIPNIFKDTDISEKAYSEKNGIITASDFLNDLSVADATKVAIDKIEELQIGAKKINYRMRDAGFSRQRYWGEPFPIVYDENNIPFALNESDLPVELPHLETYSAGPQGKGPLANAADWVKMDLNLGVQSGLTPGGSNNLTPNPSPLREGDETHNDLSSSISQISSDEKKEGLGYGSKVFNIDASTWIALKQFAKENRKNHTESEEILWEKIRNKKIGYKVRRQHAIEHYIADFYFTDERLIIEIDGDIHLQKTSQEYDVSRTSILKELGFHVIRFTNKDIAEDIDSVVEKLKNKLDELRSGFNPSLKGEGPGVRSSYHRETDTMPGYAGSSWYYLRYMDPHNADTFCDKKISDYWNQVDVYVGGAEHAVGHLLYSRMWCKALHDLGHISFDEPYKKLINQGMIQGSSRLVYRIKNTNTFVSYGLKDAYETDILYAEYNFCNGFELDTSKFKNWREEYASAEFILEEGKYICGGVVEKMSKRLYNVVNPDDIIEQYGTDTFRMYEMFLGPLDVSKPWDTKGIEGVHRFLKKFWRLYVDENNGIQLSDDKATIEELKVLHQTIKKVAADIDNFAFNTSVSQFMICTNELAKLQCNKKEILQPLLIVLNPFAPHITAELWSLMGNTSSILDAEFPAVNEGFLIENTFKYPVAIQGKARTEMEFPLDATQHDIEAQVLADPIVVKWMEDKPVKRFIFIKGKMINIVV